MLNFINKNIIYVAIMVGIFACYCAKYASAEDISSAVVLVYQHIDDEDNFPDESITVEDFTEHLLEIKKAKYNVLPLSQIVELLKSGASLPNKTIAIAFEAAYKDTLETAVPLMLKNEIPFTIFYASDIAKRNGTLPQLIKLSENKLVEIGLSSSDNQSLVGKRPSEVSAKINKSLASYRENFGSSPQFFIYPKGEYSNSVKEALASYNFKAAVSYNIGALGKNTDFTLTPSFKINSNYADLDRFIKATYAKPLYINDLVPGDSFIKTALPNIGFTLDDNVALPHEISCFASDTGKLEAKTIGGNRIEIRLKHPLIYNKTSINCTLPVRKMITNQNENPWQCFSFLLIKQPSAD